ncbi:MAG: serine/threonine-protein kinase [Planctomycetota bacterium]|nr:serine/threonine-protein kinase [Planctomycetota bacterium]
MHALASAGAGRSELAGDAQSGLSGDRAQHLETHLAECAACRARVESIRQEEALASELFEIAGVSKRKREARAAREANAARAAGELQPTRDGSAGWSAGVVRGGSASESAGGRASRATDRAGDDFLPAGYELRREISRGAQGVVYEAHHAATKRLVAVKMLTSGALSTSKQRARFEREVELAASLRHPAIVTIFDSGVTADGRPYVVMELVEGRTLDEHARSLPGPAGSRASQRLVLELMARLCDGVQAAHQRGIIHRDLKPSNVLVDPTGAPKILDFGIARLAGDTRQAAGVTREGDFVGTFAYAAPEQVSGPSDAIDVRADVYALGVVLFQLLTGRAPYALEGSIADIVQAIVYLEAPPLRTLTPEADADVELIVRTALSKEASRRYQSAGAMADDIRRYLGARPILARGDDAWYTLRKAIVRRRIPVMISVGVLLAAGSVGAWAWWQISHKNSQKASLADALVGSLVQLNQDESNARIATLHDFLGEMEEEAGAKLADLPLERARVVLSIGMAYLNRSDFTRAERSVRDALALFESSAGDSDPRTAHARQGLGRVLFAQGRVADAEREFREALSVQSRELSPTHEDSLKSMLGVAQSLAFQRKLDEAKALFEEAIALRRASRGEDTELANYLVGYGNCLRFMGKTTEAKEATMQAVAIVERAEGGDDWRFGRALSALATYMMDLKQFDEAETLLKRSLAIKEKWRGKDDPDLANLYARLARLKRDVARELPDSQEQQRRELLDEGVGYASEAERIRRTVHADDHEFVVEALSLHGELLLRLSELDSAQKKLSSALDMRRRMLPADAPEVGRSERMLGECLWRLGSIDEGERMLLGALAKIEKRFNDAHVDAERALRALAEFYEAQGRAEQAAPYRERLARAGK